jgi:hypothetical protein
MVNWLVSRMTFSGRLLPFSADAAPERSSPLPNTSRRGSRSACGCSMLRLTIHQLCRRHHVVVQICHYQKRSDDDQGDDQHTKRTCYHAVGVV